MNIKPPLIIADPLPCATTPDLKCIHLTTFIQVKKYPVYIHVQSIDFHKLYSYILVF